MAINIKDLQDIMLQNIREAERDDAAVQEAKRVGREAFGVPDDTHGDGAATLRTSNDAQEPAIIASGRERREKAAADVLNRPLGETGVPTGLARTPTRQTLEKWVTRALELADDYAGANPKIRYIAEVNYYNISVLLQAYHVDDDIRANARGMALSSVDIAEHGLNAEITRAWDAITLEVYKVHEQSLKQDPTAGRGDARAQPQPNHASASQAVAAAPPVGALGAGGRLGGAGAGGGAIMGGGAIPSTQSGMAGLNDRERLIWQLGFKAGKGDSPPMPLSAVTSDLADRIADAIIALINANPRSPTKAEIVGVLVAALAHPFMTSASPGLEGVSLMPGEASRVASDRMALDAEALRSAPVFGPPKVKREGEPWDDGAVIDRGPGHYEVKF